MNSQLQNILQSHSVDACGIYEGVSAIDTEQSTEIALRERVAAASYDNYLDAIGRSHSVAVMDHEVDRFLARMPENALILDIGGCWGWHWRRLAQTRPDVGVLIIDFVRPNLLHARNVLGELVGQQVVLMHADATALPVTLNDKFNGFDGVWTVQTFQHIPRFDVAVSEAHRVLKPGGAFANYSLNIQPVARLLYRLLGREYVIEAWVEGMFWLAKASRRQKTIIEGIFGAVVRERWSEILYSTKFPSPGRKGSLLGSLDAALSNDAGFLGWFARQRSFHCVKP